MSSDTPLSPNDHLRSLEKLVRELTPDAERYRFLRDRWWLDDTAEDTPDPMAFAETADEFDAAVDEARAKEPK
jgi:hypothetical protein